MENINNIIGDKDNINIKNENNILYDFDNFHYKEKLDNGLEKNTSIHSKLYELTFYNIYQKLKIKMKESIERIKDYRKVERFILELQTEEAKIFNDILYFNQNYIFSEIIILIKKILTEKNISFFENTTKYDRYKKPFYRVENGLKVLYIFTWSLWAQSYDEYVKDLKCFDKLKIVALAETGPLQRIIKTDLEWADRKYEEKNGVKIIGKLIRGTLRAFFNQFFDDDEYISFNQELKKFNEILNNTIGFTTITLPNDERLIEFKIKCKKTLKEYNYKEIFNNSNINKSQIDLIINSYINNDYYLYILGNNDFSESFISSEWYYQQHITTNLIEQTAITVGYLKSIEQLLYQINLLSLDKGIEISAKNGGLVDFSTENLKKDIFDTTLRSLTNCLKYNEKIWKIEANVKDFIIKRLVDFRKYRNDHIHKDNIHDLEIIKEIKAKTLELYCLLLGSLDLSNNSFDMFNESTNAKNFDLQNIENSFKIWLNRLIGGDNLIIKDIDLLFWLYNKEIYLYSYNNYSDEKVFDIESIKNISLIDSFSFEFDIFYSVLMSVEKWINDYSKNGEFKDVFNKHKRVFLFSKKGFKRIK